MTDRELYEGTFKGGPVNGQSFVSRSPKAVAVDPEQGTSSIYVFTDGSEFRFEQTVPLGPDRDFGDYDVYVYGGDEEDEDA